MLTTRRKDCTIEFSSKFSVLRCLERWNLCSHFPFRPLRPSFMNARSTNNARQRAVRSTCTCYPSLSRFSLILVVLSFVTRYWRVGCFFTLWSRCARVVNGCTTAMFLCFSTNDILLITEDSTRRDGTIISLHLSSTIHAVFHYIVHPNAYLQTHIISYRLRSLSLNIQLLFSRSLFTLTNSLVALSFAIGAINAFSFCIDNFFVLLFLSLSHSQLHIYHIHTLGIPSPNIDFSHHHFLLPLTRNFRLIEKKNKGKNVKLFFIPRRSLSRKHDIGGECHPDFTLPRFTR